MKFQTDVKNIHMKGTIFYFGLSTRDIAVLVLRAGQTHVIYQLKARISPYLVMQQRYPSDSNQRKSKFKTCFFTFIF